MKFSRTNISDVVVCEPLVHGDERGYFFESFREDKLADFLGYSVKFVQDNESLSSKGVLRGLHYQLSPHAQSKLVRVIEGEVLDIAVDIRVGSDTFGQHVSVVLSGENKKQIFIPRGFAHGFVVLSESAKFAYKVDNYYSPECDRGIAFDSSTLVIDWQLDRGELLISDKDMNQPDFLDNQELFSIEDELYG
ncbi:dTDP-4-dehydrorhamnose 3,5-epimerase [Vibrio cholerae]|uniref:dTDP-4-dehydrorhamnose 3,5-epimerase n=1 Tax=Vibrio cholerae TaxID=666 RepID=UPI000E0C602A|nr:dTDP-4-dehydrorhamnose 3,5-epimerase [Vibrio cholerae]EGR1702776.1 dTDP-4-dehydrorhamnose 3,5-epimerase [Vibrio cholerae]EGR3962707.1 dTDP-4-dehydrorhamnose 3,5-epimerase [Vibrio cholerae]TQP32868.1 dTDP-4-dehydrorhamnose 3,5-epimerase [Vibrio cholerae]HDZ9460255.1 dTDP-4-dehydrorhamnose 3,5-epimerase [Vibrio cholerae]